VNGEKKMSLYNGIKDVACVLKTAGHIELYQKVLDIGAQALEMQDELFRLKEENADLKKKKDLRPLIERHNEPFITLINDAQKLRYCSHCWDAEDKLIQLYCHEKSERFECPHCKFDGIFDSEKYDATCHSSYAGRANHLFE
jgi:hypothetical protein